MSTNDTYLAVFLGNRAGPKFAAWSALPEGERRAKEQQGMAAWKAWVDKHQGAIVGMGGPLGKTKKVDSQGVADITKPETIGPSNDRGFRPGRTEVWS